MTEFPDGPWSVARGTFDEKPLIARVNTGARVVARVPALSHRVGVAVPFHSPNADGFPESAESAQLNEIEDALCVALGCGFRSIHLVTLTMAGFREFVFHTTSPADVPAAISQVRSRHPSHEIQFVQEDDPDWDVYGHFNPS